MFCTCVPLHHYYCFRDHYLLFLLCTFHAKEKLHFNGVNDMCDENEFRLMIFRVISYTGQERIELSRRSYYKTLVNRFL